MLKIIYAGTPEFAVPALQALQASEHRLLAVYSQPDRPAGRGRKPQASPVKRYAEACNLPVCQPQDFSEEAVRQALIDWQADLMVVAAYGLLLPEAVLCAPALGCINIHASLLPRWRGASPIQQAILAGDQLGGISLMKMERGLDSGDVIASSAIAIESHWTSGELHDRLAPLGAELLMTQLQDIESGLRSASPQDPAQVTYAPRLLKQQAEIDWSKPVAVLQREVLAYNPWPVSFTGLDGNNLRIWNARASDAYRPGLPGSVVAHDKQGLYVSCGDGLLQVTELQFAGRARGTAAQALNARNLTGCHLA